MGLQENKLLAVRLMIDALKQGHKILICGNGGSAAQAQHFAAELVVRYKRDRRALPCIALTADSAILTAAANDLGYYLVFSRQVEAYGVEGDVLVAISTSGKSRNVLMAIARAKVQKLQVIGLTGPNGLQFENELAADAEVRSGWEHTDNIQIEHLSILHRWAEQIEVAFCE